MAKFYTLRYDNGTVSMIDQRLLPTREVYLEFRSVEEVADAIRSMVIRGAPAIGCAAAYGMAIAARSLGGLPPDEFFSGLANAKDLLAATRPTAVNLFWALERMIRVAEAHRARDTASVTRTLEAEALAIHEEDIATCKEIGRHGAELLLDGQTVLTHCNAGSLATGDYGTALGVIRGACERGKRVAVVADETRPFLQGARLTAWELQRDGIPVTLITDNMAASIMSKGQIDRVIVGADRIASNGDTANKIGTLNVAILAKYFGVPFSVAAPRSTIDMKLTGGSQIPIEERNPEEVTHLAGQRVAPEGIQVRNPAFDVTPAVLIDSIITECGVLRAPFTEAIWRVMSEE